MIAAVHFAGALVASIALMWTSFNHLDEGILVWGIMSLFVAVPLMVATAAMSYRIERIQTSYTGMQPWLWVPYGLGVSQLAHWLPACLFSPVLALAGFADGRLERRLEEAAVGILAWIAAGLALGIAVVARRALERRDMSKARLMLAQPAWVPSSLVLAVAYGTALAMPSLMWLAWLDEAWEEGTGGIVLLAFVLFSIGASVIAGGITGSWLLAVAPFAPDTSIGARSRQVEVAGALFTVHWALIFPVLLLSGMGLSDDLRFSVLFVTFMAIILGTTVWSWARTRRVLVSEAEASPIQGAAHGGA